MNDKYHPESICPFCRHKIAKSSIVVICSRCDLIYHLPCGHQISGKCACGGKIDFQVSMSAIPYLNEWRKAIAQQQGYYSCSAIFLVLPADKEAIRYLTEYGEELDIISQDNCRTVAFGNNNVKIAQVFKVGFQEFPCLIIFQSIKSGKFIVINLKGITAEEIAEKMRLTYSIIEESLATDQNPLKVIESYRGREEFKHGGKIIIGKVQNFIGKTFEMTMEAFIKASIK